jgi:hypothetical protein
MATRSIETGIEISAPPTAVWAILTGFTDMPAWNPFIKSISGDLVQGSRLSVHIAPPGKSGIRFKPTVLAVQPQRELRWRGHFLLPGIFDGEHYFLLEPMGDHGTRFTQGETFTGVLVGLLEGTLTATEEGFRAMNKALKERAENQERQPSSCPTAANR